MTTNADRPAMPHPLAMSSDGQMYGISEHDATAGGLTKREHFAVKAMDSVQAFILAQHDADAYSEDQFIEMCVKRANKLLAALNQGE